MCIDIRYKVQLYELYNSLRLGQYKLIDQSNYVQAVNREGFLLFFHEGEIYILKAFSINLMLKSLAFSYYLDKSNGIDWLRMLRIF
jgi:hypothetical protein